VEAALGDARYLRGGPLVVIVTLSVATPGAQVGGLPAITPYGLDGIGVSLERAGQRHEEGPLGLHPEWARTCAVVAGAPRRALCLLYSMLRDVRDPAALTLLVAGAGRSNTLALDPVAPSPTEAELLATVRAELRPKEGLNDWAAHNDASPLDERPLAELGPFVLHGLLRRWRKGPAKVPLAELDALPPALAPERAAFRAEHARARGEDPAAAIAAVRALGVGLDWWMDDLGRGYSWTGATL
jgi:hypothetical protein